MDPSDQNVLGNQIAGMSVGTFRSTTTLFTHTTHTHTRITHTKTTSHTHNHTTLSTTTYSTQLLTHTRHLAPISVMLFGSWYLLRLLFVSSTNYFQIVRRQCCPWLFNAHLFGPVRVVEVEALDCVRGVPGLRVLDPCRGAFH